MAVALLSGLSFHVATHMPSAACVSFGSYIFFIEPHGPKSELTTEFPEFSFVQCSPSALQASFRPPSPLGLA